MGIGRENIRYLGGVILGLGGTALYLQNSPAALTFLSYLLAVASLASGWREDKRIKTYEEALEELVGEKRELRRDLKEERQEREEIESKNNSRASVYEISNRFSTGRESTRTISSKNTVNL